MTEEASKPVQAQEQAASAGGHPLAWIEADLIRRAQGGEDEAFAELVTRYQNRIYNVIYRMVGRVEDAEELAQEAFLRAYERLDQFRGGSRFYTWLYRIATNLTISNRRRSRRVKFIPLSRGGEREDVDAAGVPEAQTAELASRRDPGPEADMMSRETSRRVTAALNELDEEFRLVVVLRDMENLDYSEIAEVLELPAGTVKSRLHRARCLLKEKLRDLVS